MAWIIYKDYIREPGALPGTNQNAEGRHSRDWVEGMDLMELPVQFRLLDDDGEAYYLGRMSEDCGLEPLLDFGLPNAGATRMQWKTLHGYWEEI